MKPTHLVTDAETGVVYEFSVDGDIYHWRRPPQEQWRGPHPGWFEGAYSRDEWSTKKIRTFYGNEYGGVIWAFASKNFHTHVEQSEACRYFWKKMGVTLGIASPVENTYQTHIKNDLITSQRLKLKQRKTFVRSCLK